MPQALVDAKVAKNYAEAATQQKLQAKLDAEAAAITQRVAAEQLHAAAVAAADADAVFRTKAAWWTGAAVVGSLVVDFYLHESPSHIKRRMRRMLLSFKAPIWDVPASSALIKVPQLSLFESISTKPS